MENDTLIKHKLSRVSNTSQLRFAATENESSQQQHQHVTGEYSAEQVIKKSRFIVISSHCESWENVNTILVSVWEYHPKSLHVYFGFVAGHNPMQERSSNNREPTGTTRSTILGTYMCSCTTKAPLFHRSVYLLTKKDSVYVRHQ